MKLFRIKDILPQLPNLLLRRRFGFQFEMIPYMARDLSYKKIVNFFVAGMNQFMLPSRPLGYPVIAQIEPANFCNLSCPLCFTVSETGSRKKSLLDLDGFQKFIDDVGQYLAGCGVDCHERFSTVDRPQAVAVEHPRGTSILTNAIKGFQHHRIIWEAFGQRR